MSTQMVYVHALSPIRVGVGQGAGVIDLPVIREKHTGLPYLPGSSVKGVLRNSCQFSGVNPEDVIKVFGPEPENVTDDDKAGGVVFADLRIMFLPVRSYRGSFMWVTSPMVLARFQRDLLAHTPLDGFGIDVADDEIVLLTDEAKRTIGVGNDVLLEDLRLSYRVDNRALTLVENVADSCFDDSEWQSFFMSRVGIVSDSTLTYLSITAMEVVARNRIDDDTKVVAQGALWWEEFAPAETIFSGILMPTRQGLDSYSDERETLIDLVRKGTEDVVQIGASATVGRGLARVRIPADILVGGRS